MSLNDAEISRTAAELRTNLELSGLSPSEAAADLLISETELSALLTARDVDPASVWQLRDYLEQAVFDAGQRPAPFTVLTEDNRRKAAGWFTLRDAPRHDFGQPAASPSARPRPGGTFDLGSRSVARIGYGAMQLERLREDRATGISLIRRAVELGIDHIDTAQFYGNGLSNELIHEALSPGDEVAIVSKVGAAPDPGGPFPMRAAQRPEELRAEVEANLRTLGIEQLAVVNLRRMDTGVTIPMPDDQVVSIEDQLAEMVAMRDEGLIGGIGMSNTTIDGLRTALPAGIDCVQNAYSLIARGDDDMLELCEAEGIAWVPFFPLGSGFEGMPKVTDEENVIRVAAELGATPSQVGLAWLLDRAPNVLLIPGTASVDHLGANVEVGELTLTESQRALLDEIPTSEPGTIRP
ncbi:MAG: aldo/keto reductase [Brevibacterium aurantiacum]